MEHHPSSTGGSGLIGLLLVAAVLVLVLQNHRRDLSAPLPITSNDDPYAEIRDIPGQLETHGVTQPGQCDRMEQRFKAEGRRIRLVRKVRNRNPGATLRWICVFEGPDADPGYYHRYNESQDF